jgi:hypothetical protein
MPQQQPLGFVALWLNKDSEYHAGAEEESETGAKIQQAFVNGRTRGIKMFGRYGCRWSSERQYFTFWLCPNLESLEATMDDLERAGDFKFADSEHIIGIGMHDVEMTDQDLSTPAGNQVDLPFGFFAIWRRKDDYYHASPEESQDSDRAVRKVFDQARALGVRMLGRYDCRWSTHWDYFTFWEVPSFEVLQTVMDRLEQAPDFKFAESRHVLGVLEPHFRFGTHLQPQVG